VERFDITVIPDRLQEHSLLERRIGLNDERLEVRARSPVAVDFESLAFSSKSKDHRAKLGSDRIFAQWKISCCSEGCVVEGPDVLPPPVSNLIRFAKDLHRVEDGAVKRNRHREPFGQVHAQRVRYVVCLEVIAFMKSDHD